MTPRAKRDAEARAFFKHDVTISPERGGCWTYEGPLPIEQAARKAFELLMGGPRLPPDVEMLSRCRTPRCIRPNAEHLVRSDVLRIYGIPRPPA